MHGALRVAVVLSLLVVTACGAAQAAHQVHGANNSASNLISDPPTTSAAPKNSTPPSFPPCPPITTATPGINNSGVQVGPDSWEDFITSNQWIGPKNGSRLNWYHVYAGMTGEAATPPHVPAVWVDLTTLSTDGCTINVATIGDFTDRSAGGTLSITSVENEWVHLESASGAQFSFDLTSDRFSTLPPDR
jgi:hypothetical protein